MTKPEKKKLQLFILLLVALGVTAFLSFRVNRAPNPVVVQADAPKTVALTPQHGDARIRLDLLEKKTGGADVGQKNLFIYETKPALAPPPSAASVSQQQAPGNVVTMRPTQPIGPAPPPPPPPIPLKYVGFAFIEPNSKALIATLLDDTKNHANLVEGEVYLGRYRVVRITESTVEVEDLEFNRRQTLPLVQQ